MTQVIETVAPANQHDRWFWFVQKGDRCDRSMTRRCVLEFLQLRFFRKPEVAFSPFEFLGKGFDPGEKSLAIERTRQTDSGGDRMVGGACLRLG